MNVFQQDRRRTFINNMRIEGQDMLDLYRLVKSIDLHVKGDFDITKYGRLQKLKEESFQKEAADLKQVVAGVYQNVVDDKWRFKIASLCALEFYLNGEPRANTSRRMTIDPSKVSSLGALEDENFEWYREGCFRTIDGVTVAINPLFEMEVLYINNFKGLISWYNMEGAINREFFRT